MAKKAAKRKGRSGQLGPVLKIALIGIALLAITFIGLMQSVRMGFFGVLPTEEALGSIRHEQATLVLANDGSLIGKLFAQDRTNVRYEDLPRHLIDALVATEDARFFSHEGVDGRSYLRVFFRTLLGGDRSGGGGSTISQQIIKNLYGRQRHGPLTVPVNKMKEALVAQRLERVLTKNDVLVLYFNSVPFGENAFGIEAAAQRFFGKPARKLNVQESAVLVGMLKANTTYNPRLHPEASKARRDQVLGLMKERGHLTARAADSLRALPVQLRYTGGDALDLYGYFTAQVGTEARTILTALAERTGVRYDLEKDGLRINTTLDPVLQRAAHDAVHDHLSEVQPKLDRELRERKTRTAWEKRMASKGGARWEQNGRSVRELYDHKGRRLDTLSYRDSLWHYHRLLNGAVLMMDPASGAVKAWVGGNDHRFLPFDLVQARRAAASTFKPFIHAAGLMSGMKPCTYLDNSKHTYAELDDWSPDNFDRDSTEDEVALWYALARSMNRPTVDLYFRTPSDTMRHTLAALGLPVKDVENPAIALGATEVSLREMVPAYGAFAMRGKHMAPLLITGITDAQGRVLYKAKDPRNVQSVPAGTAATITAMLQRAVDQGTGTALRTHFGLTASLAGKTGTSQDYGDAWFVAYTPGLVIGTWVGAFDPAVHFSSTLGTGGQLALPIAGRILKRIEGDAALRKQFMRPFTWVAAYDVDMDCAARREPGMLQRGIDDVFGNEREQRRLEQEARRKEKQKKESLFDRLFKKKS